MDESIRIPLQLSHNFVVASIQVDLNGPLLVQFRKDLLEKLHSTRAKGVIIELSGVSIMDFGDFSMLRSTVDMVKVMGVPVVIAGLKPGVVAALVELDADTSGLNTVLNLDAAFRLMEELQSPPRQESIYQESTEEESISDENLK